MSLMACKYSGMWCQYLHTYRHQYCGVGRSAPVLTAFVYPGNLSTYFMKLGLSWWRSVRTKGPHFSCGAEPRTFWAGSHHLQFFVLNHSHVPLCSVPRLINYVTVPVYVDSHASSFLAFNLSFLPSASLSVHGHIVLLTSIFLLSPLSFVNDCQFR